MKTCNQGELRNHNSWKNKQLFPSPYNLVIQKGVIMSKSQGILTNYEGEKYEGEWKEGLLWNGTIMDEDGNIISKIADGVEVSLLPTEAYSHIEWKENDTITRT